MNLGFCFFYYTLLYPVCVMVFFPVVLLSDPF